jgi:hypothetical protein
MSTRALQPRREASSAATSHDAPAPGIDDNASAVGQADDLRAAVQMQQGEGGAQDQQAQPGQGQDAQTQQDAASEQNYIELLGERLGKELWGAIQQHMSADWLVSEGQKALQKGALSLSGMADVFGMDDQSNQALATFGTELLNAAAEQALKWLGTPKGKALADSIRNWVGDNPVPVVAAALLAGAGYAVNTLYKGNFSTSFGIAKGLDAKIAADWGSVDDFALRSIEGGLTWVSGDLKVEASGGYSEEGGATGSLRLSFGDKTNKVTGDLSLADGNQLVGGLSAMYGSPDNNVFASARKNADGTGVLDLGTHFLYGDLSGSAGATTDLTGKLQKASLTLGLSPDETLKLMVKLGYEAGEVKGAASATYKDGDLSAKLAVEGNLTQGQLDTLVAELGFQGEDALRSFSARLAYQHAAGGGTANLKALFDANIGDFVLRGEGRAAYDLGQGGMQSIGGDLYLAGPLGDDMKLIGGLKVDHDFFKDRTKVMPGVGVQIFGAPLMLHTDFKDEVRFSIGIRF